MLQIRTNERDSHLFLWHLAAEFIHVCKRNVPDFNQCIVNSVEQLKPVLETGGWDTGCFFYSSAETIALPHIKPETSAPPPDCCRARGNIFYRVQWHIIRLHTSKWGWRKLLRACWSPGDLAASNVTSDIELLIFRCCGSNYIYNSMKQGPLRPWQSSSCSRISLPFKTLECPLPLSRKPTTGPYPRL